MSLHNTLDLDGVVHPKVGAAVHELRVLYRKGAIATMTWLQARGQMADALTKMGRNTPLEHCIRTGVYDVRLSPGDFPTKSSSYTRYNTVPSPVPVVNETESDNDGSDGVDSGIDTGNDSVSSVSGDLACM